MTNIDTPNIEMDVVYLVQMVEKIKETQDLSKNYNKRYHNHWSF